MNRTVTVRNLVLGDGITKICVPIIAHTYEELQRSLAQVSDSSYDLVEFRADFYFEDDAPALSAIRRVVGSKPILYTIRTMEEGGEIEISDDSYRERNLNAADMADLIDIQYERLHSGSSNHQLHSNLVGLLQAKGVKVVLSWHDFAGTPDVREMVERMKAMQREGCDLTKIAVMPICRADVIRLMEASAKMLESGADRPFITMSMGNLGRVTRVAGSFTGSCISFGTAGESSAPGQIPSGALRRILEVMGNTGL